MTVLAKHEAEYIERHLSEKEIPEDPRTVKSVKTFGGGVFDWHIDYAHKKNGNRELIVVPEKKPVAFKKGKPIISKQEKYSTTI
jgi:hypothetical protein